MLNTMPRRAYSYIRISTGGKQARGDGLRRQDDFATILSREEGWTLDDALHFTDSGKSGYHSRNLDPTAALSRFLDLVNRGRITPGSILIVENLDRLSRAKIDEAYDLFRRILKTGVWIATREPRRIYKIEDSGNMLSLLEPLFIFSRAHEESAIKSLRAAAAWESARRQVQIDNAPTQARPPVWILRTESGWTTHPEKLALVREIAAQSRSGLGSGEIAARLIAAGTPTLSGRGQWTGKAVCQLLTSRTLIGEFQPCQRVNGKRVADGRLLTNHYPAALTVEEYQATRAALSSRRQRRGRPAVHGVNLFTGLLTDAGAGRRMSLQTANSHGKLIPYLSIGQVSGCARVRYDALEACVLDTLAMLRPQDVLEPADRCDQREHRIAELTARTTSLDHRQRQLQEAVADPDQDAAALLPALSHVSADLKATAAEREQLQMETRSGRAESLSETQTLRQLRDDAQGEERAQLNSRIKAALPSVVSGIWLQCQRVDRLRQIIHVQIWLRSGTHRYVQILPQDHRDLRPWQIGDHDQRRGAYIPQEANATGMAQPT
jgi:DNA invertase Pin-like site-specific DNA recombinase